MAGYFELKPAAGGQFVFNLKAGNQRGHSYERALYQQGRRRERQQIASVNTNAPNDDHFHRKTAKDGSPYFVLVASNGQTIGKGEMICRRCPCGKRHQVGQGELSDSYNQRLDGLKVRGSPPGSHYAAVAIRSRKLGDRGELQASAIENATDRNGVGL